ncbi:hypothetical protein L208DRAFT_1375418 [Tricholoma matsutake]|nr:hypothetical protein L208DRAFT_1375418 [Tricholoma matsutake 945]
MSRSTYTMEHFNYELGDETLDIDINSSSAQSIELELLLMKFIAVVGPFAKAIQCLESLNTNLADVYLYWLAIVSQLVYLFSHNQVGLSAQTMEDIRVITNKCFDQMINKSPNDVYITVFFLNLHLQTHQSPVYSSSHPQTQWDDKSSIKHRNTGFETDCTKERHSNKGWAIVATALEKMNMRNPLLAAINAVDALHRLKDELKQYAKGKEPFNHCFRDGQTVLSWWTLVQKDEFAQVLGALAIKIYSVCAVSMVDEQMASMVTSINTAK